MWIDPTTTKRDALRDTELVLFVDHAQPQTFELDPAVKQRLGTNQQVDLAGRRRLDHFTTLA